jgi:hypothetical protein
MTRDAADQLWGYSAIARAFVEAGGIGLAAELDDAIEQLHRVTGNERSHQ